MRLLSIHIGIDTNGYIYGGSDHETESSFFLQPSGSEISINFLKSVQGRFIVEPSNGRGKKKFSSAYIYVVELENLLQEVSLCIWLSNIVFVD